MIILKINESSFYISCKLILRNLCEINLYNIQLKYYIFSYNKQKEERQRQPCF